MDELVLLEVLERGKISMVVLPFVIPGQLLLVVMRAMLVC